MVAAAIVVGVALATWASTYGVKLQLDNFAKSLMYYLFMYGVGLRVGPSFFNSLKKDGLTFTILAVVCAFLGLGNEAVGKHQAALRMLPAHQGFHAHHGSMRAHLGLVIKHELLPCKRIGDALYFGQVAFTNFSIDIIE